MYAAPPLLLSELHTKVPDHLHLKSRHSAWTTRLREHPMPFFLEGPAFDREGNLFCVDIPHSRIFKISPSLEWTVFAEYDGEPNGLKIHKDGRIFVTDVKQGLVFFDPLTGASEIVVDRYLGERFKGLNDLTFASNGDIYFTDMGLSSLDDPTGRVYRLRATGELDLLFKGLEAPNGLVLNESEDILYVAITRANRIISLRLLPDQAGCWKSSIFIQLSGSPSSGPDGLALDERGNLAIVHAGFGTVWIFSRFGEPVFRIKSCAGMRCTNVAFGGPDRKTLFITEAEQGAILKVQLPESGKLVYGLS